MKNQLNIFFNYLIFKKNFIFIIFKFKIIIEHI